MPTQAPTHPPTKLVDAAAFDNMLTAAGIDGPLASDLRRWHIDATRRIKLARGLGLTPK